ncbi:MAG: S24 family peptidase [Burkholderiales bacterium]|nr:S24 family peptidase [Burkholderiales bacterium]
MNTRRTIAILPAADETVERCSGGEPFALQVLGDSMAPEFDDGDIVVVEPEGLATEGAYVVARGDGGWTLRQLARGADGGWELRALNPVYPAEAIAGLDAVRGVVIQKSRPGRRRTIKRYAE